MLPHPPAPHPLSTITTPPPTHHTHSVTPRDQDDDQVLSYDEFVHQVHSNVDRTSWTAPEYSANTPEGHPQTYAAMSVLESEGNLETYEYAPYAVCCSRKQRRGKGEGRCIFG
eukprot:comp23375_c1_seq7/m.38690 comp23375_c1_seq7/g.38690  ORF comp23375_c1_seq7/g.38690 comp23375_c1_seq7/m.38690 type:complete len:113 (-) comp23375_c1_seq7:152-490(-)